MPRGYDAPTHPPCAALCARHLVVREVCSGGTRSVPGVSICPNKYLLIRLGDRNVGSTSGPALQRDGLRNLFSQPQHLSEESC